MKSAVFARPNLKALLLGAILIAVVQNFIANGHSQASVVHARAVSRPNGPDADIEQMLEQAEITPTAQLYARISRLYERQGEIKRALFYLRKAQLLAQLEESDD